MCSSNKRLTMSSSRRLEELEAEDQMQLAWLPDEIMYLIIGKVMVSSAYLARFSAVCKRWRRLVCDSWPKLVKQHQITIPFALLPVDDGKEEEVSYRIYNLMGEFAPAPVISLPCGFTRIIGSSFGWLIVTDISNQSVSLFNPLSKSHIRLPPLHHQPGPLHHLHGPRYLVKGVLSNPPPRPEAEEEDDQHFDIAITMSHRRTGRTATIALLHMKKIGKLESLRWVSSRWEYEKEDGILDVNSIGGRICIILSNGTICRCKWSTYTFCYYYYGVRKDWPSSVLSGDHLVSVYLLESSSSAPLVVFGYKRSYQFHFGGKYKRPTVGFKIFTLTSNDEEINEFDKTWNWTEDLLNWTEIKTLGNDVIFLSDNADSVCIQVDGSKLRHPAAGSIYFFPDECNPQATVFGVFNIDQNCITHFSHRFDEDTKFLSRPPIWLMPFLRFSSIS